jgi:iron complex outermembrane receptor protein
MTYVKYSTGYRAGGFNVRSNPPIDPVYQPEKIKNWEAGFKIDAFDRRLRLNGAAFINNYDDLQTGFYVPPSADNAGGARTLNANAKFKGVEVELIAVPTSDLTLTAMLGYVDAKFKNYPTALEGGLVIPGCTPISDAGRVVAQDCVGISDFPSSPDTTADFSATYALPATSYGQWSATADYSWRSSIDWSAIATPSSPFKNAVKTGAYGLLGARIALSDIPLSDGARAQVAIFGNNLTDEKYAVQGVNVGFFAEKTFGTRRTFGVEGKVNF